MREKKELNIRIGEQVRIAREEARLTQEQLAERIDVSPQYVSDLERGVVGISVAKLKCLCISLGVSSDQILFGSSRENQSPIFQEKCRTLSKEQVLLLMEIVDRFIDAVHLEKK